MTPQQQRADYGQCLEVLLSAIYHRILKPGDTVVDCGANGGLHAIPMGKLIGPTGQLTAYEPLPDVFADLTRWVKSNPWHPMATLRNVAVGAVPGAVTFYRNSTPALSSARIMSGNTAEWSELRVPMVRLDDEPIRPPVAFIKLDLEGGEKDALVGASGIVTRDRPVIAFECGFDWAAQRFGYPPSALFDFFADRGYEVYDFAGTRATAANFNALSMVWELVAIAVEDPRGPTILATIRQFNERLTRHPAAKDWNEVVRRVGDPLNTDLFR